MRHSENVVRSNQRHDKNLAESWALGFRLTHSTLRLVSIGALYLKKLTHIKDFYKLLHLKKPKPKHTMQLTKLHLKPKI